VLRTELALTRSVLEIGSGTGQHAVHFARHLPHLTWQPTDLAENHPSIRAWAAEAGLENLREPLVLDVSHRPWPVTCADAVFTANTAHIVSWPAVEAMFAGVGAVLPPGGRFCLYGPFSYGGRHTSASNVQFDAMLRARDPQSGVRDFEALAACAHEAGLVLRADHAMPANNRILVWEKQPTKKATESR
jgi:cyclopropane fatty-acyl-phospholipid synthase-like methyltransferase